MRAEGKTYNLDIFDDPNSPQRYYAHLFQLGQQRFLDILATERPASAVPVHHLFKIEVLASTLQLRPLNRGWITERLKNEPEALAHIKIADPEHPNDRDKDEVVLTATTRNLQSFLRQHLAEAELFGDVTVLKPAAKVAEK